MTIITFYLTTDYHTVRPITAKTAKDPKDGKRHFYWNCLCYTQKRKVNTPLCCVDEIKVKTQIALLLFAHTYTSKIIGVFIGRYHIGDYKINYTMHMHTYGTDMGNSLATRSATDILPWVPNACVQNNVMFANNNNIICALLLLIRSVNTFEIESVFHKVLFCDANNIII